MSNILSPFQGWHFYWQQCWLWGISGLCFRDDIVNGSGAGYEQYPVSYSGMKLLLAAVLAMRNIMSLFQGWNWYWQQCWLWALSNILFLIQEWNCYWQQCWLWAISCFFFRDEIVTGSHAGYERISCFCFRDEIVTGSSAAYEQYPVSVSEMKLLLAAVLAKSNILFLF